MCFVGGRFGKYVVFIGSIVFKVWVEVNVRFEISILGRMDWEERFFGENFSFIGFEEEFRGGVGVYRI